MFFQSQAIFYSILTALQAMAEHATFHSGRPFFPLFPCSAALSCVVGWAKLELASFFCSVTFS